MIVTTGARVMLLKHPPDGSDSCLAIGGFVDGPGDVEGSYDGSDFRSCRARVGRGDSPECSNAVLEGLGVTEVDHVNAVATAGVPRSVSFIRSARARSVSFNVVP